MNPTKIIKFIFIICFLVGCAVKPKEPIRSKPALPKTEESCIERGGKWIFAGPQNVSKYCFLLTSDAGKKCQTSNDCQSECVEKKMELFAQILSVVVSCQLGMEQSHNA